MKSIKMASKLVMAAAALALSSAASAFVVSGNGVSNASWAYGAPANVSATASFTVTGFSSTGFDMLVNLSNTTSTSIQSGLMSLGMMISPDLTGSFSILGTNFDSLTNAPAGGNFPGGYSIDFCVFASNNCSGGNINQGLASGASDSFKLHFTGTGITSVNFSTLAVKWQTANGSFECAAGQTCGSVPEPGSLGLVAAGLAGLAWARRRQAKA